MNDFCSQQVLFFIDLVLVVKLFLCHSKPTQPPWCVLYHGYSEIDTTDFKFEPFTLAGVGFSEFKKSLMLSVATMIIGSESKYSMY